MSEDTGGISAILAIMNTPLIERLRKTRLTTLGTGVPELCEEAAREIERLSSQIAEQLCEIDYLRGTVSASTWENDT